MQNFTKNAKEKIKETGLKKTKPRQMIIKLLAQSSKALSPYDMRALLKKKKIEADVVTIYRILETLEKISLAHKVLAFNGYIRCSTSSLTKKNTEKCHHYLLCQKCHAVEEVKGENLSKIETKIAKEHKFKISSHYLEFMGLCKTCQQKLRQQKSKGR